MEFAVPVKSPSSGPLANVLLVDDRPENLLVLEAILADLGANLVKAASGEDALRELLAQDFAVVLLDVQMQGMNGYETAKLIRGRPKTESTPIIFLTGYEADHVQLEQAYDLGAVDFLVKPLAPVILRAKVAGFVRLFHEKDLVRRQAEHYRALIEETTDYAIFMLDPQGHVTSWNTGAERLYGYTAAEIIGKPISLVVPSDHPDEMPSILERICKGERIEHFETVRVRKDGSRVEVSFTISPIKNSEGKVVGASKIARDITASKRHEADLSFIAEASKLLGELRDVSSTLKKVADLAVPRFADWCTVDMLEADGSLRRVAVAHVDPAKVELSAELHRRFPSDPDAPHGAWNGVWNVIHSGKPVLAPTITDEVLVASIKDPDLLDILKKLGLRSYIGVPLARRGKVLGVVSFVAAESGRHYDAKDLAVAEDLAYRAAVAIENARLYQELQEADRRKDEFLAILAHELRNPMAPILNSLEILKLEAVDPAMAQQTREMMERQIHHLVRLVDDLLDVSRVMRGKIQLRQEPIELATAVVRAVESAQPFIEAQGHQLDLSLSSDPLCVHADPVRLAQVIGNLLTNAAKYTEAKGHIWFTLERNGEQAVLRIRDNGIGIAPDVLPHIFDLFVQADHATTRSQGGLGIGLTLVKNLVEMHDGAVEAHSEGLGKGSEFIVRLPLWFQECEKHPKAGAEQKRRLSLVTHRLLVVDDNRDAADSFAVLLRSRGHDVRTSYGGAKAIELTKTFQPEVVFLDLGMPEMDGYEVARRIRGMPGLEGVVLAAITGWGQEEDRRRTSDAGFDYHFVKPVELRSLEQLFVCLNRRS